LVNPKNQQKNSQCIYSAFIDGNIFERLCDRHSGGRDENGVLRDLLFKQIRKDISTLKDERYFLTRQKRTPFEDKVISEFRTYINEEMDLLERKKFNKETLRNCKVFETSFVNRSDDAKELKSGNQFNKGIFLIQSTLQFYYEFDVKLTNALKESGEKWKLKLNMKDNLLRIAEKIKEYSEKQMKDKNHYGPADGWVNMKDMIRACIIVETINEIWGAYDFIKKADYFRILSIKDKLDSDLKNVTIIFDFDEKMIGEL
jgi:hypothetical protein